MAQSAEIDADSVRGGKWADRDLFPLDADVTVYWPDVRPCYDATPIPPEKDAPCCNVTEPDGILCDGTMRAGWPVFTCDTCRAHCGAQAHPTHVLPPGA